ncbi:predicted protein [Nematostella vectensis]|uniref:BPTI/Kunitz inhibitor domain-containing protein n=3 Tax=Nematostella vectensis TaxID=45351 RepID=A7S322_NEMVE|nr:predicted protein [Nematostella vectensis]|eukprot:XP_001633985.1 predicted protein [Nematostella vectensis]
MGGEQPSFCSLPAVTGRCMAYIPSFYYDMKEEKCKEFIYGGCNGNLNRFDTQEKCEEACMSK